MSLALRFLGVGSAQAVALGSASAVLTRDGAPLLLLDCGPETLSAYLAAYGAAPQALFLTHGHLDHIGGMERLYYRVYFDPELRGRVRVYAPATLVPLLQERLANYPDALAEGGANFWDAFQLIPVGRWFWHQGLRFDVLPVRHHAPGTAHGLALRGSFVYTGDTRPVPELLHAYGMGSEPVFHDCGLQGNPSHTGLDDIEREYPPALRERLVLYHYASTADGEKMRGRGMRVAARDEVFALPEPVPEVVVS
ncbi:MAG: MBL fold metallo-hydrolase [Xanthomonadales bacterium]|nr:MBL fold metallo-hydrolase [Xanthomonadales bacterium]